MDPVPDLYIKHYYFINWNSSINDKVWGGLIQYGLAVVQWKITSALY